MILTHKERKREREGKRERGIERESARKGEETGRGVRVALVGGGAETERLQSRMAL